jgi:putative ABC transport system ATP-binding protein
MDIVVNNIVKTYGENDNLFYALNKINCSFTSGEFVAVTGASGSGKSTLLNILSGLDVPDQGQILYNGENLYDFDDEHISIFRRNHFGFIFQNFNLIPILTVRENIELPLLFAGKRQNKALIDELCVRLNITEQLNKLPSQLSGGQQQRVAIGRALVSEPDVVFADEPTGNLDTENGENVLTILKNIVELRKASLIMVTHNMDIARVADRAINIKDGVICKDETL